MRLAHFGITLAQFQNLAPYSTLRQGTGQQEVRIQLREHAPVVSSKTPESTTYRFVGRQSSAGPSMDVANYITFDKKGESTEPWEVLKEDS
ncbi:MAG: hypothetical protein VKJ06_01600 [Vampirovibrionales bacterium]|nr:hypothetical protein [Vampirovibrionales bacterium]